MLLELRALMQEMKTLQEVRGKHRPAADKKITSLKAKVSKLSNAFFTLIPHDFGLRYMETTMDAETISKKLEMLDSLNNIDEAMNYLVDGVSQGEKDIPFLDMVYQRLGATFEALPKTSVEYSGILRYAGINGDKPAVKSIFKVERWQGEIDFEKHIGGRTAIAVSSPSPTLLRAKPFI